MCRPVLHEISCTTNNNTLKDSDLVLEEKFFKRNYENFYKKVNEIMEIKHIDKAIHSQLLLHIIFFFLIYK
jgi:hypothetical protein